MSYMKKIVDESFIRYLGTSKLSMWRPLAATCGCFDIVHTAHLSFLSKASNLGNFLVVLLNSDSSVRKFKGPNRPIQSESDRALLLAGLSVIGAIFIFDDDTPLKWIEVMKPDIWVKGGTYIPERIAAEKELVESYGGSVALLPEEEGYSTTSVIEKVTDTSWRHTAHSLGDFLFEQMLKPEFRVEWERLQAQKGPNLAPGSPQVLLPDSSEGTPPD